MTKFREKMLKLIDVPVGRVSFRKDKWGELCSVSFARTATVVGIGEDASEDDLESFLHSVKNGSKLFVSEAIKVYGANWKGKVKHRS